MWENGDNAPGNVLCQLLGQTVGKCEGSWCGSCLRSGEDDGFPIQVPINDGGQAVLIDVKHLDRFMNARNGYYLLIQFQCGQCHFRNLQGQCPIHGDRGGELLGKCIHPASLDAF
jgi:hypothetical protein